VTNVAITGDNWNAVASSYSNSLEESGTTYYTTLEDGGITHTTAPGFSTQTFPMATGSSVITSTTAATLTVSTAGAVDLTAHVGVVCGALLGAIGMLKS
jgi:hypothetical protein